MSDLVPLQFASCIIAFLYLLDNGVRLQVDFDYLRFFNRSMVELPKKHPYIDVINLRSMLWKSLVVNFAFDTLRGVFNGLLLYGVLFRSPSIMVPSMVLKCLSIIGYLPLEVLMPIVNDRSTTVVKLIRLVVRMSSLLILESYYYELKSHFALLPGIQGPEHFAAPPQLNAETSEKKLNFSVDYVYVVGE